MRLDAAEKEKKAAAAEAAKFVESNQIIGLGTGSTAFYVVEKIGELVARGLKIKAVPTSEKTRRQAASLNIPLVGIDEVDEIDLTIDGADEFDGNLNLIKGGGGALLMEKMVASLSKREIIVADSSKKVEVLGKFKVPIEATKFTANYVMKKLAAIGGTGAIRERGGKIFITDTGNLIVDADFGAIADPVVLADKIDRIVGVVCHGLFINLAERVIMARADEILIFEKQR